MFGRVLGLTMNRLEIMTNGDEWAPSVCSAVINGFHSWKPHEIIRSHCPLMFRNVNTAMAPIGFTL